MDKYKELANSLLDIKKMLKNDEDSELMYKLNEMLSLMNELDVSCDDLIEGLHKENRND